MTLEELYEKTEVKDHVNIHVSGDRVFVKEGNRLPVVEFLIINKETGEL